VSIKLIDSIYGAVPYGTPLTLVATVTNTSGSPAVPTGSVRFMDGTKLLGQVVLVNGSASFTTSALAGSQSHNLTAVYSSNANFTPVTSAVTVQQVDPAATSNVLTDTTPGPTVYGTPVTFWATVSNTSGTAPVPAGKVTFYLDYDPNATSHVVLGSAPLVAGVATFTTANVPGGPHTVTAVYFGGNNFLGSTSSAHSQPTSPAHTNILLKDSASGSVNYGQPVTFTATVTNTDTSLIPAGYIVFLDGTKVLKKVKVDASGIATYTTQNLAVGSHMITAVFVSNPDFAASTSNAVSQTIL
jgi:hypothetical protein